MHELIEAYLARPDDDAFATDLAMLLGETGPVMADDGSIFFRAADGRLRTFRLTDVRPARAVSAPGLPQRPATARREPLTGRGHRPSRGLG